MGSLSKRLLQATVLLGVFALFFWGVVTLAKMRFEQGDSFAPYSSFRADPLGCRGLYGALSRLSGVEVRRYLRPLSKLPGSEGQVVMVLGLSGTGLGEPGGELQKELLRLAEAGSRVLVALRPPTGWTRALREKHDDCDCPDEEGADADGENKGKVPDEKADNDIPPAADADETVKPDADKVVSDWHLEIDWQSSSEAETVPDSFVAVRQQAPDLLPEQLTVHTPLIFRADSADWQPVYSVDGAMVVAERSRGKGSLVVFAESYLFSNEALRERPPAAILAWTLDSPREVVFVESHLGVNDSPGLMTLIRRWRLDGILLALFAIAALAVWKNALPLVPSPSPPVGGVATRDHFSGLVNLLGRHIPLVDLGEACHREWRRGLSRYGYPSAEKRRRIEQLIDDERQRPANERQPLALYRKICQILSERMM